MIKFLSYVVAFLLLVVFILGGLYLERGRKITALQGEKNALMGNINYLERDIEERNKRALETSKRFEQIEKMADETKNKGGFNWSDNLPNDGVVERLRKD